MEVAPPPVLLPSARVRLSCRGSEVLGCRAVSPLAKPMRLWMVALHSSVLSSLEGNLEEVELAPKLLLEWWVAVADGARSGTCSDF